MSQKQGLCSYFKDNIIRRWNEDAFTDYGGATLRCHDVARKIEKLHIMYENCGIRPGDKIALCGRNMNSSRNKSTISSTIVGRCCCSSATIC